MFTGLGYDEDAMHSAHEKGADGYISKGRGPHELYAAVSRIIAAGKLPSEAA